MSASGPDEDLTLPEKYNRLLPLHEKLGEPQPGDWLIAHPEFGQTFRQYVRSRPIMADDRRRIIYIQPLGEFTKTQKKIVDLTVEFMGEYFRLPVKIRDSIPLDQIPESARRKPGGHRSEQLQATYILCDILKPRILEDAVTFLGLTAEDLWPGEGWNYVFGQASLGDRVGVWSLNRFGDPDRDDDSFRSCLLRTLKTATHETGHMFSMEHCTLYECNMCGSNNLGEADRRPLAFCPHCLAKLCYATRADPVKRFRGLMKFYEANGFKAERDFCEKSLEAIRKK